MMEQSIIMDEQLHPETNSPCDILMEKVRNHVNEKIIKPGLTMTEPGSLKYLLWGSQPSRQSISIKMGHVGEFAIKSIIEENASLELLKCGVQTIDEKGKKKDLDLMWKDEAKETIYYREAKANIELDSEKLPATIEKIKQILEDYLKLKPEYSNYKIDIGVLNWSIYNRNILTKKSSHIRKCESDNIKVEHMEDILKLLNFEWSEQKFYEFWRGIGKEVDSIFI
jgi:hypothetical protein